MTKKMLYSLVFASIFSVIIAFFYQGLGVDHRHIPSPLINKPVPKFSVPILQNESQRYHYKNLYGQYSILNVWATWCSTCLHEHDFWLGFDKQNVKLIGIDYRDNPIKALAYLNKAGNPYDVVLSDTTGQLGIDLGVYGTPQTFLIDPQGKIIYKHIGPVTAEVWQSKFAPQIKART